MFVALKDKPQLLDCEFTLLLHEEMVRVICQNLRNVVEQYGRCCLRAGFTVQAQQRTDNLAILNHG